MLSQKNKKILINISILFGAFIVATSILIGFSYLSKGFWKKSLKTNVIQTVEKYAPGTYSIGDYVDFYSNLATSAAVYKCYNLKDNTNPSVAVIIRLSSISGPVPAVFICNQYNAEYAGLAINNGKAESMHSDDYSFGTFNYWQKNLPEILKKAGIFND